MKKITTYLIAIFTLILSLFVPVRAEDNYVIDTYGMLTPEQVADLNEKAARISAQYDVGLYIRIVPDKEGQPDIFKYAEYIYKRDDMGLTEEKNGYLLTICMDDRSYLTTAYGNKAHASFTDYGKDQVESQVEYHLRQGNYYQAFDGFLNDARYMLEQNEAGTPVDVPGVRPKTEEELKAEQAARQRRKAGVALTASPLVSLLTCLRLKGKNKSKGRKLEAHRYIPENGLRLRNVRDIYLFENETRTLIPKNTSSGSGGGGTTINSSGFSHGSGGHF